jgi:hypothetical protein
MPLLSRGAKVVVYDNFDEYYTRKEENIRHNLGNQASSCLGLMYLTTRLYRAV